MRLERLRAVRRGRRVVVAQISADKLAKSRHILLTPKGLSKRLILKDAILKRLHKTGAIAHDLINRACVRTERVKDIFIYTVRVERGAKERRRYREKGHRDDAGLYNGLAPGVVVRGIALPEPCKELTQRDPHCIIEHKPHDKVLLLIRDALYPELF